MTPDELMVEAARACGMIRAPFETAVRRIVRAAAGCPVDLDSATAQDWRGWAQDGITPLDAARRIWKERIA